MLIGILVPVFAAICAFVISYGSYQNQFMDTRTPIRLAIRTAIATLVFFLVAMAALPWILGLLEFH